MVRLPDNEQRPRSASEGAAKITGEAIGSSVPSTGDIAARARRHDYALRVVTTRRDGHTLTRYYAALSSAEAAMRRATDRGAPAVIQLVRIMPTSVTITDAADFGLLAGEG